MSEIYLKYGMAGTRGDRSTGDWIVSWQSFLAGENCYLGDYSPNFGPKTKAATEKFQENRGLKVDGEVGDLTTDLAVSIGLEPMWRPSDSERLKGWMDPSFPQPTDADEDGRADLVYLGAEAREDAFGEFEWEAVEGDANGRIRITDDWQYDNIVYVYVPELEGVVGAPADCMVPFHRDVGYQLQGFFREVRKAGLLHLVKTWGGSFVPRYIRGSTATLSNHAWAVAFDLNAAWNGLGKRPALVGQTGQVRSLVKIAERWGFFWGGWYRNRKDGMHFECVKILTGGRPS